MKNSKNTEIVALDLSVCAPTYSKEWGSGVGSGSINPLTNVIDDLREIAAGRRTLDADIMIRALRGFAKTIPFMFAEGDNVPGPYKLLWDVRELADNLTVAEMRELQRPIRDGSKKMHCTYCKVGAQPVTLTVHTGANTRTTIDYDAIRWEWRGIKRATPNYMQALEATLAKNYNIESCTYRDLLHILRPDVDGEQFREIQRPFIEAALISKKLEWDAREN